MITERTPSETIEPLDQSTPNKYNPVSAPQNPVPGANKKLVTFIVLIVVAFLSLPAIAAGVLTYVSPHHVAETKPPIAATQHTASDGLDTYRVHEVTINTANWKTAHPYQTFGLKYPSDWQLVVEPPFVQPGCAAGGCKLQVTHLLSPDYVATPDRYNPSLKPADNTFVNKGVNISITMSLGPVNDPISNRGCAGEPAYNSPYLVWHTIHAGGIEVCESQNLRATIPFDNSTNQQTYIDYSTSTNRADYLVQVYYPENATPAMKDQMYSTTRAIAASFELY